MVGTPLARRAQTQTEAAAARIRDISSQLHNQQDLDPLVVRVEDARFVLLGEASHGTSEFYIWRALLSQRLISEKGSSFIAVEGDWPDCYRVNRVANGYPDSGASAREVLHTFRRWPTWMWANWEITAPTEWLLKHNAGQPEECRVGFYGLDVYSLWDSVGAVIDYLRKHDGNAIEAAMRAYRCFEPYHEDVQEYARATAFVPRGCEVEVVALLGALRRDMADYECDGREGYFAAGQNGLVVKNAEHYHRAMISGGPASWNVRDRHMVETLDRLMQHHGPQAKPIVWEHNTHILDARATNMADAGMVNVGQLTRERWSGDGAVLVGFGSHHGTVIAGYEWDAHMQRMRVPEARDHSWEDVFHTAGADDKLTILPNPNQAGDELGQLRGHRAIGVVYDPDYERWDNYVPTVLPQRYDAILYLEETQALHPLHLPPHDGAEPPQTYPWNV